MLLRQRTSWVDEANELVKISDVLGMLGVQVSGSGNTSKKVHCPFGFYHSDNGVSRAMRVYFKSNTAYCFSCSKSYSSVSLAATSWDCSLISAALRLLEDYDFKPKTLEQRWAEATEEKIRPIDTLELSEALKIYCSGLASDWNTRQLDIDIAQTLTKCLSLLPSVKTEADADKWLLVCKQVMREKLES